MSHVLEDLNLEGMAYAAGAGLNTTKKCLDGTRTEILKDIIDWITRSDDNAPRILWLHGQAGRGKSAIAHTIASWVKAVGAPGTCFCFARDRQAERREEKILTTIARDLADRDPAFRRALSNVVSNNHTLKTTRDVAQQWERFILEPLSKINGEIVGNVVVVIDALDESGPERSRKDILSLLKTSEATHLPANFRILLTSRTLPDIERAMRDVPHVKATSLDNVRRELVERDIRLYVSKELGRFPSIGATEVQNVVKKSDGLFEWARRACEFIRPGKPGVTLKERYDDLMALESEEARTLLDTTYFAILEGSIPQSGKRLEQYRSVMQQIVMTLEPLPMAALNSMRENFPNKQDRYDVILILEFMSPVLGGIVDRVSAVRPLHESFYDFLTDHSRSGIYFIDTSNTQHTKDLAFAALQILHDNLRFNICELESSYLANAEVDDLSKRIEEKIPHHLSYSSRFWARHLQKMVFDLELAVLVKAIIGSKKILFWLEIISLLGMVGKGVKALGTVATWLQVNGFKDILELVEDEIKLIQNFGSVMVHSTPHLYASALPFIPSNALLSMMLLPNFPGLARVVLGGLNRWPVEQQLLHGHTSEVKSVTFSPDGKRIVSSSKDNTVRVWDAEIGVQIGSPLEGHTNGVNSVAFSPAGKQIVSGSWDRTVRVWNAPQACLQMGSPPDRGASAVKSVAFSSDGKKIVSGSDDKTVRVWDVERGALVRKLEGHSDAVNAVALSPDGEMIASGSWDETVRVWDVGSGVQIFSPIEGHTDAIFSVAFSPDGKRIASGSDDQTVRVWDAGRGVQIGSPLEGHTSAVESVAFSLDGKIASVGSPLLGHNDAVFSVAFSPNGKTIISGSDDKTVRIWDVERGVQVGSPLESHTDAVNSVAFSPDGKCIVSCSNDNTIRVWDVQSCGDIISDHEKLKLDYDGWIRGPQGRLLLWIPPAFRQPFYSVWTTSIIPIGHCIELDLSLMAHGKSWHKCLKEATEY
ncbi:hypothetical protein M404DRAFT_153493 [Pisolithus tinctorius Marx 270]|uniref:NACHT domain-containing protein n=1 Tax=Pisolithus tinctorius Marx 270 TaxID=870435 RepID=A0A0C3NY06_PISTI|nr:hypothetical protein M404DRAFT_153493 [Pisolithus tinctorius Marx 270]